MKSLMELHYYRPSLFDFMSATNVNTHILYEANIDSDSVVLDVGAFTGSWAQHIAERYDPLVYAFEPNPKAFEALQEKSTSNPKLRAMPYGLGDEDMTVEFTPNGPASSSGDERNRHLDTSRIKVDIADIDRIWRELQLGQVDLMKLNIGGAEFPLLDKMIRANLLNNVDCFIIQFHEWHPGAYQKRRTIREDLSKTHRLEWDYHFLWEKWVRI
jgi:FkbM family methyltransferase